MVRIQELARAVLNVYYFFLKLLCPATGRSFFAHDHAKRVLLELNYVAYGRLSDHPGILLYRVIRTLSTGLVIYRNMRTSSSQEAWHMHLSESSSAGCKHASLRHTKNHFNEFNWIWCVRALRKAGVIPPWVYHYNLAAIEEVYDVIFDLLGQEGLARIIPGWRRTKLMVKPAPVVQHGPFYALDAQKRQTTVTQNAEIILPPVSAKRPVSEVAWMSTQLGSPGKNLRLRRTCTDVENLLTNSNLSDPNSVVQVAFDGGLHLSLSGATKLSEDLLLDEKARDLLESSGYYSLQQRLRTRVPFLPAAAQINLDDLAHNPDGSNELPGPYPTTSENLRRPAQLLSGSSLAIPGWPNHTITPVLGITGPLNASIPFVVTLPISEEERKRKNRERMQQQRQDESYRKAENEKKKKKRVTSTAE